MKRWIITISIFLAAIAVIAVLLLVFPSLGDNLIADNSQTSGLSIISLLDDYGNADVINADTLQNISDSFTHITADTDDVLVTISELCYDGIWMYTATEIQPRHPDQVLLMPGAADVTDLVSGVHGEKSREDNRSFIDAAMQDKKKLLAVYVYPKEFDDIGEYFIDYQQLDNNTSVFLSGANINGGDEKVFITWSIQVYEVDTESLRYELKTIMESEPQEVTALAPIEYFDYKTSDQSDLPFNTITLAKTALTTYVLPHWNASEDRYMFFIRALDKDGKLLPAGLAPDERAVSLNEIPQCLYIELNGNDQNLLEFQLISQ